MYFKFKCNYAPLCTMACIIPGNFFKTVFLNVGNKPLGNRLQKFDPALYKSAELCFPTSLLVDQVTAGHDLFRDPHRWAYRTLLAGIGKIHRIRIKEQRLTTVRFLLPVTFFFKQDNSRWGQMPTDPSYLSFYLSPQLQP